jgi:hypothetical protein
MQVEKMVGFGAKQAWLAVRDGDADAVIAALGLRDLGTVDWRDGIDLAYLTDDRLVLTPLLPGADGARWLLVTGRWLLRTDRYLDVAELSSALGTEVQSFATHRVIELHWWAKAIAGDTVRAFEYVGESGEVNIWRGTPDEVERGLGLPATLNDETSVLLSEHDVMRVAKQWSVDPTALDGQPAPGPLRAAAAPDRTPPDPMP